MGLLCKVGSFQATTDVATTVVQVRGVGFQPKVVLFWWNGRDGAADASGEADLRFGFGWMSGASSRHCIASSSDHAALVGECDHAKFNNSAIATIAIGTGDPQAVEGQWDFSAWDADGFDLIVDDAFATAFMVHYLALGGDDVQEVATGTFSSPSSPGTVDVTPGFPPDVICVIGDGSNADNTVAVDGLFSLGFAFPGAGAASNFVLGAFADDGPTTSDTASYCKGGECLASVNTTASVNIRGNLDSLLGDGFRLNFAESLTRSWYYLAIRGPQVRVGNFVTSTTLNATNTEAIGFLPRAVMFVSACRPASTSDTPSAHWTTSIGAATSVSERSCQAGQDKDNVGTMDCFTGLEYDEVYQNASVAATQATEGLMDLDAILFDGFRTIMDDGDDAANFVGYVALGDTHPAIRLKREHNTLLRM